MTREGLRSAGLLLALLLLLATCSEAPDSEKATEIFAEYLQSFQSDRTDARSPKANEVSGIIAIIGVNKG
ncbi:MAG: hypothetical protein WBM90_01275 [Acidimicrobiia bacterium]